MRSDIQVLRGVAVLAVLMCHAFPQWFPYGYLGVDLFFVISGFLMTKMIVTDMDRARFTFVGFYVRRARRLLPAAYSTLALTTAAALLFLPSVKWPWFVSEIIGAVTFTANFVTAKQFAAGVNNLPLAHFWSLSLEEQFYFLFPLLLWFVDRKRWAVTLVALSLLSIAAFFLMPSMFLQSRAWELLAGSLLYLGGFTKPLPLRFAPLERIGDWSYSLYLVHYPLLSFAVIAWGWPLPPMIALSACFLAVALSALQYQYVEQRWRIISGRKDTPLSQRPYSTPRSA